MSSKPFLDELAGQLEGDFEMVEVHEREQQAGLFVKNSDASAVVIATLDTALNAALVRISSVVVENIEHDQEAMGASVILVNELNQDAPIGRWVYYPEAGTLNFEEEQVVIEGQVFGNEDLDTFRFLIRTIYNTIDHLDDRILARIGSGNLASKADPPDWA